MKQNQKGFTLIELLAVIVILAIIALIATPIILNVVNDSRKKAAQDSAYGVVEAVKLAYSEAMTDNDAPTETVTIDFSDSKDDWKIGAKKVNISGTQPDSGAIQIDTEGNISFAKDKNNAGFKINKYSCTMDSNSKITCGD